jgi:hypothetical protein
MKTFLPSYGPYTLEVFNLAPVHHPPCLKKKLAPPLLLERSHGTVIPAKEEKNMYK